MSVSLLRWLIGLMGLTVCLCVWHPRARPAQPQGPSSPGYRTVFAWAESSCYVSRPWESEILPLLSDSCTILPFLYLGEVFADPASYVLVLLFLQEI